MKTLILFFSVLLSLFSLEAASNSSEAIIRVLNKKNAGSVESYEKAVETLVEDAKLGKPLQQFLIALISREKDAPSIARISEEVRSRYLESSRDIIFDLAKTKNNSMAWFLMSLENNNMAILKHAADLGNVQALNTYATIKMSEVIGLKETFPEKYELVMKECYSAYKRAAEQGDVNALNSLGLCYQNGYGCEKNEKVAFKCFYKASEKRHPEAVNNLGRFYLEGIGVEKDLVRALKCFEISSSLGNVWGTINRATSILMGLGCKKNEALAIEILEKESIKGCVETMDLLAECYSKGIGGIKKDSYKTMLWRIRARAARGDKGAKDWLKANKEEL